MDGDLIYYEDRIKELEQRVVIYEKALKTIVTKRTNINISISDVQIDFIKIATEALNYYEGNHIFYF